MQSIWTSSWNICSTSDVKDNLLRAGLVFFPMFDYVPCVQFLAKNGIFILVNIIAKQVYLYPQNQGDCSLKKHNSQNKSSRKRNHK